MSGVSVSRSVNAFQGSGSHQRPGHSLSLLMKIMVVFSWKKRIGQKPQMLSGPENLLEEISAVLE